MHLTELARAALPLAAPVAAPAWGPPVVELFGVDIPIASMAFSLFGLWMARGVSSAREGKSPGGLYLTGTLTIILIGLIVEKQPTPGMAVAWGVGIGASGIVAVDLLKERVINVIKALTGKE